MVKDVGWDDSVRKDEASRAGEAPPFGALQEGQAETGGMTARSPS